jgi:WG containing repeat
MRANWVGIGVLLLGFATHASATGYATIRPANHELTKQSGLFVAAKHSKYGFIDKNGKVIVPFQFDDAHIFSEGLAAVCVGGYWGISTSPVRPLSSLDLRTR